MKLYLVVRGVGDTVLVKQKKVNKLTSPFNPVPHIITSIKGTTEFTVAELWW